MRKRICYLLLLCLSAYIAIIYNSPGGILLVGVELLFPLFLFVILLTHAAGITVQFSDGEILNTEDGGTAICLNMINRSIFPANDVNLHLKLFNQSLEEKRSLTYRRAIGARNMLRCRLPAAELSCGIWQVRVKRVRLYDLIGLFCLKKKGPGTRELVVMPRLYEVSVGISYREPQGTEEALHYHPDKSGNDMSHIQDLREYRPGDRLAGIHWKMTAKREELTVKVPGLPMGCAFTFFLQQNELSERFLAVVYTLAFAVIRRRFGFYMVWMPKDGGEPVKLAVRNEGELYEAMLALMRRRICLQEESPYLGMQELDMPKEQLLLDKELCLFQNGKLIAELKEGNLEQKLLEMELIV